MRPKEICLFAPVGPLLACAILMAPAAVAQRGDVEDQTYFERVEVTVVNVEVFVTDKQGNPVTDLSREDFQIFEDNDLMEITNFYAHRGGQLVSRPEIAAPVVEELPTLEYPPLPEDQQLHLVVYIDNYNISPLGRNRVFRHLRSFLRDSVDPQDRVMLVSYDRSLEIRQPFTRLPEEVASSLDELEQTSGGAAADILERQRIIRDMENVDTESGGTGFSQVSEADLAEEILRQIEGYSQHQYQRVQFTVGALKQFVSSLSGVPGRKAVLYVSDGVPMRPGEELYYAWDNRFGHLGRNPQINFRGAAIESLRNNASDLYQDLIGHSNANRVTFYTIAAAGHRSFAAISAESRGMGAIAGPGGGRVMTPEVESLLTSNYQGTLEQISLSTGGRAFTASQNLDEALGELTLDFDNYYSLGYSPPHSGDGRFHNIKVKVNRKGVRLRYREGYRDKTAEEQMSDRTFSALLFGVGDNPLQVALEVGEEKPQKDGNYLVTVMVKIPFSKLLLIPQEDHHEGKVSLFVTVQDSKGRTSPVRAISIPIRIPNDQLLTALGQVAGYRIELMMRDGEQTIAVGVRDEYSAAKSTLVDSLIVGKSSG